MPTMYSPIPNVTVLLCDPVSHEEAMQEAVARVMDYINSEMDDDCPTKEAISYTTAMFREWGMAFGDNEYGSTHRPSMKALSYNGNRSRR